MPFTKCNRICYCIISFVFMNSLTIGMTSTQPSYLKAEDDSSSEDNPSVSVSRSEQPQPTAGNVPNVPMVKNVHYIIPNKDDDKKQLNYGITPQGSELPQDNQQNIDKRNDRTRYLEAVLRQNDFDFDESKESFRYRKGHSTRIYSNSYCVKITPLYSEEGACEKELVKIHEHCDSTPYEVFKTTCYLGSDFVGDSALRLDTYLYSISPKTLVFMLNDGLCLKKEYFEPYPEAELKDRSYCNEIKRLVRITEERDVDKTVPFNTKEDLNHLPPISSALKGDNSQHNYYVRPGQNTEDQHYDTEKSYIQKENYDKEQFDESDDSSNKNIKQEAVNVPEKVLHPKKRKASGIRRFIPNNPLRRLMKRKQKRKEFSVVLVYDKTKKPMDV